MEIESTCYSEREVNTARVFKIAYKVRENFMEYFNSCEGSVLGKIKQLTSTCKI